MTQYATAELSDVTNSFIQAAEASELAARLNAVLQDTGGGSAVLSLHLAGGGDGHTFVVAIERSESVTGGTALTDENLIGCYLAASESELAVAKDACVAAMLALPPPSGGETLAVVDDQIAGASKGTRFMGMIVAIYHGGG
jgi:hypothetical protein